MSEKIQGWSVQQAFPFESYPPAAGTWFCLTEKLNGVRATYHSGRLIARSGAEFSGMERILNELSTLSLNGFWVFDGELVYDNPSCKLNDNERFRLTTGIMNSIEDPRKKDIKFIIFDMLPRQEFDEGSSRPLTYKQRRLVLSEYRAEYGAQLRNVEFLPPLYEGCDQSVVWEMLDQMVANDKEGLMLNLDYPYQKKRHRGILKIKRFYTADLPIVTAIEGKGRLKGTLGSIEVMFGNNIVGVGSGFTDEQRKELWKHRYELPGTLAEVKYKEISYDKKTGLRSLQFPVFVRLREDKSDISEG